ncbi:hypothetical protein M8C21_006044 [Ambrosia artemisiifolia]|uniref:WPP domain-interacting tail-anchored protein 2 n=1 Tax=Ambrosia artemisiifolia TaxID=4212 RepID=A0AAD5D908_AMBAR|nr:hypothetical protein M8C21_006044 [Ambrosia artemisiifolia]
MEVKPRLQTVNKVNVLRMLEKSLSRELDLEKKLTESKQDEEDLRLKLRLTEQVAFIMEEAAEVVWGRFLEAENAAVVLMGVSRDVIAQHKLVQFNLNGFNERENGFRLKLENCIKLLNSKDASIEKLNSRITQLVADNLEVSVLREKVKSLEEKVNESESNLKKANESNELFQDRVREMESVIESLKDDVYTAENRAETAEGKMSLLEKQSRDLEIQAQHAKASSEAGQEQQNMLYSAIWDMETLIDELKQKVSVAEMKAENAEEQCLLLTDTNSELTKEVEFLRAEVESLETSLSNANLEKMASTKDISAKTKLIMDTVLQLAKERERITRQDEEIQVLSDASIHDPEPESSVTDSDTNLDDAEMEEPESRSKRMLLFRAIFVLSILVLAAFFINWKPDTFDDNAG